MVASTCDGASLPMTQAEPVETAKPSLSSLTTQRCQRPTSGIIADTVFHSCGKLTPTIYKPGKAVDNCVSNAARIRASLEPPPSFSLASPTLLRLQPKPPPSRERPPHSPCRHAGILPVGHRQEWFNAHFCGAFQKADALWAAELVDAVDDKIAMAQAFLRQLANPLGGVTEERHFPLTTER